MIRQATNLFAFWTVLGSAWAWFVPPHFLWVVDGTFQPFGQSLVSVLLGVIMLGMGLTLSPQDFRRVLTMPRAVAAGVGLQFTVMPMAGVGFATIFGLETGLAVGLILVACCPGGTASNVVTYLARANLALSVTMTLASTMIAIIATPLLTGWLAGVFVEIDRWALFRGMVTVVLLPVIAGVLLNRLFPTTTARIATISPLASVIGVVLIVGGIIAQSKTLIIEHAGVLLVALFLLHATGFALGYLITRWLGFAEAEARTCSIEVGMQNSGLGSTLASAPSFGAQFATPMQAALAPVPSAVSALYHVVIGSLLAALWRRFGGSSETGENE
ncbi:bile acid:sodium symporter family protein [Altererythrobacter arenosus]|uniref:Bile acid:sodium symporter family protein n=1 Tax=Altererythrobacter arenosus TaxID=3032592 RepID=A0ABY8FSR8_9SPHN|nr:bile acid:sodium symporter family protein [Altererythrobacter sp. CAU 1644]WFL77882.1 bile acid:sodium symporter family protein [Altererythrobacter sp. CAU 1644]